MSSELSDVQFKNVLELSIECARRHWNHSTDLKIADIIASSKNKDNVIEMIARAISESSTEQEFVVQLTGLFR